MVCFLFFCFFNLSDCISVFLPPPLPVHRVNIYPPSHQTVLSMSRLLSDTGLGQNLTQVLVFPEHQAHDVMVIWNAYAAYVILYESWEATKFSTGWCLKTEKLKPSHCLYLKVMKCVCGRVFVFLFYVDIISPFLWHTNLSVAPKMSTKVNCKGCYSFSVCLCCWVSVFTLNQANHLNKSQPGACYCLC